MESLYLLFIIFTCMAVNVFVNKIYFPKGSRDRDLKILHLLKNIKIYITKKRDLFPPCIFVIFFPVASTLKVIIK